MKKAFILGLAITVLSPFAAIAADDQYPASNFEPSVIYIDEQLAAQSASAAAQDNHDHTRCPEKTSHVAEVAAAQVEVDPKYPAYNFQPKVIYP
jgi:hypothetical protein